MSPRLLPASPSLLLLLACCGLPQPLQAQQNSPSASASSAANSAGTTVNNPINSQINTSTFYGFGPGINCPTTTFSVSGFGGSGTGSSGGDVLGATVDSNTYGGIIALTVPLGFNNAAICSKIGRAQAAAIEAQVANNRAAAAKTEADIALVTILKCLEILKVAQLSGPFGRLCQGVNLRGVAANPLPPPVPAPASGVRQRFEP
ncbi:MAG: hypothetical protein ACK549_13875 [Cyanobacteriota bacterium]